MTRERLLDGKMRGEKRMSGDGEEDGPAREQEYRTLGAEQLQKNRAIWGSHCPVFVCLPGCRVRRYGNGSG